MGIKRKKYTYKRKVNVSRGRSSKKGRKLIKFFVYLCLAALLCALIYTGAKKLIGYAYASESISVKEIDVTGCKNVTGTEIKELLPFNVGDNILKIDLSQAEEEIMKVKPELKNISINRRWQKVRVKLYERTPEAFIMSGGEMSGVDFDNKPFPLRGFMSGMKIPVITEKTEGEREGILNFIKIFKPVSGNFLDNIAEIERSNSGDIVFKTYGGALIYWGDGSAENMRHKFDKLQKIYADASTKYKEIEYIDMTFYGLGKAVVKPKAITEDEDKKVS